MNIRKTIKEAVREKTSRGFGRARGRLVSEIINGWLDHWSSEVFEKKSDILDMLDELIRSESFGGEAHELWEYDEQFRKFVETQILGLYVGRLVCSKALVDGDYFGKKISN